MEHLLLKSKCSIFHNIFKYMIFQRHQKALLWSKGLINAENPMFDPYIISMEYKALYFIHKSNMRSLDL